MPLCRYRRGTRDHRRSTAPIMCTYISLISKIVFELLFDVQPLLLNKDCISTREHGNIAYPGVDCRCGFAEVLRVRGASHGKELLKARDERRV